MGVLHFALAEHEPSAYQNIANSSELFSAAVAYARVLLAGFFEPNLAVLHAKFISKSPSATFANIANNGEPLSAAVANAHAVLARSCALKSLTSRPAAHANAANSILSDLSLPLCDTPYATLASCRA